MQCATHKNPAELLCIHPECQKRLMCLLCDHEHTFFSSILQPKYINYSQFSSSINKQIDKSFQYEVDNQQSQKRIELIKQYYENIKRQVCAMIDKKLQENLNLVSNSSGSDIGMLRKARIKGDYHSLPPNLFNLVYQIYKGEDLQKLVSDQYEAQRQKAYSFMSEINAKVDELLAHFHCRLKVKPPKIMEVNVRNYNKGNYKEEDYNVDEVQAKLKVSLQRQNDTPLESILSDCIMGRRQMMVIGYDKNLRVLNKRLEQIATKEYGNILTKISQIEDEIYAIGVSKELHIEKIPEETKYEGQTLMKLRGHTSRINDLAVFNTRIIGSSSDEGLKIWDLYKQRCEYTLKDKANPSCFRFLPGIKNISIGYNSHEVKIYSLDTMKIIRLYNFEGVPLIIDQQNRNENVFYVAGFPSHFGLVDVRLSKMACLYNIKSEAITALKESIFKEDSILLGERGGIGRLFDMRKGKTRIEWEAHEGKTNVSKPNGVVKIFEQSGSEVITAGCNDKLIKYWELGQV